MRRRSFFSTLGAAVAGVAAGVAGTGKPKGRDTRRRLREYLRPWTGFRSNGERTLLQVRDENKGLDRDRIIAALQDENEILQAMVETEDL
jgi:hypothetical protein